jgi:protein SCO1/2
MLRVLLLALALTALWCGGASAREDRIEPTPAHLKSVDVTEHPNAQVPGVLGFVDETGKAVRIEDYLNKEKPVILTLNYMSCPMLCTLTLNGMFESLGETGLVPGKDYQILTVSFNPNETEQLAKLKKQNYGDKYEAARSEGWSILTGKEQQINTLCQTVGFTYNWIPETQEYAHPSVLIVLTPDGRVSRYIYGVKFDPQVVRLTLVEASQGKIGTPLDKVLLFCYHYDAATGAYAPMAMNIMRLGGAATLLALALVLGLFWSAEKRRKIPHSSAGAKDDVMPGSSGRGGPHSDLPSAGVSNV